MCMCVCAYVIHTLLSWAWYKYNHTAMVPWEFSEQQHLWGMFSYSFIWCSAPYKDLVNICELSNIFDIMCVFSFLVGHRRSAMLSSHKSPNMSLVVAIYYKVKILTESLFWFSYGPGDVGHELTSKSIREDRELGWKVFFLILKLCTYICIWTHTPWQASGGQWTVCRSRFSPSTTWILRLKLGPSSLETEACFHWVISPALSAYFNSNSCKHDRVSWYCAGMFSLISLEHLIGLMVFVNVHSWTGHSCRDSFCVWT